MTSRVDKFIIFYCGVIFVFDVIIFDEERNEYCVAFFYFIVIITIIIKFALYFIDIVVRKFVCVFS